MDINRMIQELAEQESDLLLDLDAPLYMGYTDEEMEEMIELASCGGMLNDDEIAELFDI